MLKDIGNTIKVGSSLLVWPQMLPASGEVMMIASCLDADLNVKANKVKNVAGLLRRGQAVKKISEADYTFAHGKLFTFLLD